MHFIGSLCNRKAAPRPVPDLTWSQMSNSLALIEFNRLGAPAYNLMEPHRLRPMLTELPSIEPSIGWSAVKSHMPGLVLITFLEIVPRQENEK
jgi:hypothetical protein